MYVQIIYVIYQNLKVRYKRQIYELDISCPLVLAICKINM